MTVTTAEPVKRLFPAAVVVRPAMVIVAVPLVSPRAVLGVRVTMASGMPSPFSSFGSAATVAVG
jgi:hypothetical protein